MKIAKIFGFIGVFCLFSCGRGTHSAPFDKTNMEAAKLLELEERNGITIAYIRSPWDSTTMLHTYVMVPDSMEMPKDLPQGTLIRTPLKRMGVSTTVHCGLFAELGCATAICGVFDAAYMHFDWVKTGLEKGNIVDFGSCLNPTLEKVIETTPDAIFLTPFEHSGGYGRLEQLGIPIIECAEYMEHNPLGEAEWMKFYATLVGKKNEGDSIFTQVKNTYLDLKDKVAQTSERPKVLTELMVGTTWYVPGGQSTMGQLLADAGADYVYADTPESGSLSFPFEKVFADAQHADIWLIKYNQKNPLTYDEIGKNYAPYKRFGAFKNRCIWGCNLDESRFYDETPFHPELTLQDFICILHPEILPETQPLYFAPLK